MKTEHQATNIDQLLDMIGAGVLDPSSTGKNVVTISLWDGRTIYGNYHRCEQDELDAETNHDMFMDTTPLVPLVQKLLDESTPFITETGTSDMVCTLRWTITGP